MSQSLPTKQYNQNYDEKDRHRYTNTFTCNMLKIHFQMTQANEELKLCKINNKKSTAHEH